MTILSHVVSIFSCPCPRSTSSVTPKRVTSHKVTRRGVTVDWPTITDRTGVAAASSRLTHLPGLLTGQLGVRAFASAMTRRLVASPRRRVGGADMEPFAILDGRQRHTPRRAIVPRLGRRNLVSHQSKRTLENQNGQSDERTTGTRAMFRIVNCVSTASDALNRRQLKCITSELAGHVQSRSQ